MQRPDGVTILAVLAFIGAGLLVLAGLAIFLGGAIMSHMAAYPQLAIAAGIGGTLVGVICLAFAGLEVAIGIGLWKLQNWARVLTIVLCGLALLSSCFTLLFALTHMFGVFFFGLFFRRLVLAAVQVWIVIYLLKPHVKQAFGTAGF
jgi:hypothetical protein